MQNQALLLLDFQHGICGPGGILGSKSGLSDHAETREVIGRAAAVLSKARERGIPVIHVGVAFDSDYGNRCNRSQGFDRFEANGLMQRESAEAAFLPQVAPATGETVIYKGCVNPFIGTHLLEVLVSKGVNHLIIGGTATNYVVESTARHAGDMGFKVTVLEDICASYNDEMHRFAIERTIPLFASIANSDEWLADNS